MERKIDPVLVNGLIEIIGNGFFTVQFVKKDGTLKLIQTARLNVTSRMADKGKVGTNEASDRARATLAAHALIPCVDMSATEGKGWRSFKADSVVYIKGAGLEYGERQPMPEA